MTERRRSGFGRVWDYVRLSRVFAFVARSGKSGFGRVWGYVRLALLVILTFILILQFARADWSGIPPTVVFIVLLAFLEAVDRGWIRGFGGGGPPRSR